MPKPIAKRSKYAWTPEDIAQLAKHKIPKGHTYSSARAKAHKLGIPFQPKRRHAVPSPVPQLGPVKHSLWTSPEIEMLCKGELPPGRSLASAYQIARRLYIPFKRLMAQKAQSIPESGTPTPEQSPATEKLCTKQQSFRLVISLNDGTTLVGTLERFIAHIPAQTIINDITREIPKVSWTLTLLSHTLGELGLDACQIKRIGTDAHCLTETPCPEAVARYVNSFLQL